jgi:hypothetical protein
LKSICFDGTRIIVKVTGFKDNIVYGVSENGSHWCNIEKVMPVPLTPNILEKNGFEDIGDDTYQLEEKPYWFWVDFYKHQYGCEFDTSTYEYEDSESRMKLYGIPYVHELQHAMRLCGIEKTIGL